MLSFSRSLILLGCFILIAGCNTYRSGANLELGALGDDPKSVEILESMTAAANAKLEAARESDYKPLANDSDGDGLTDEKETEIGTDPYWPDTDNDRLPDGYEYNQREDPLTPNAEHLAAYRESMKKYQEQEESGRFLLLLFGTTCTSATINLTNCTGTCRGTCLLGSCKWSWDPIQWAYDKANSIPCPGWSCFCLLFC